MQRFQNSVYQKPQTLLMNIHEDLILFTLVFKAVQLNREFLIIITFIQILTINMLHIVF